MMGHMTTPLHPASVDRGMTPLLRAGVLVAAAAALVVAVPAAVAFAAAVEFAATARRSFGADRG